MSIDVRGEIRILKDDRGVYKTTLVNKEFDDKGDEVKNFMQIIVGFRKGIELKNKSKIEITNGFMSFFKVKSKEIDENGDVIYRKYPKLIVLDFKLIEEGIDEPFQYSKVTNKKDNTFNYSDFDVNVDDLPF